MKVTQEKLPASQIGLEIEIPAEMSKKAYEQVIQQFTRSLNIPGFRKGKVPRHVLIQRFGASRIKAAAVEELIENSLKEAVKQEEIQAIGNFQLRSSFEDLVQKFEPGSPLTFSAAVDVPPEVTLKQYTDLQLKAEEVKYDPEQVDKLLEERRSGLATLVPVEGRAAQMGDVAVVDFNGRLVPAEGETDAEPATIPGGEAKDFQIELQEGRFIEGFIDGIVGMTPGETKEVSVQFPEGYPQEDLAGQPAIFTVTLTEIKEKELPALDDDFAREISEFETLEELRTSLESQFQEEAERKTKANKEQAILSELLNQVEADIPETLIQQEVDYLLTQTAMQLSNQGMDVKQLFTKEMVPQLRERSRPEAVNRIKRTMALGEIAKKESISVEPTEVETRVKELVEQYSDRDLDRDRVQEVVQEDLLKEKILAWLEEHSTIELVPEGSLAPAEEEDFGDVEAEVTAPDAEPAQASATTSEDAATE